MKCPSCETIDLIKIKYEDGEGVLKGIKIRCPNCSRFTPILPPESTIEDGFKIIKEADRW